MAGEKRRIHTIQRPDDKSNQSLRRKRFDEPSRVKLGLAGVKVAQEQRRSRNQEFEPANKRTISPGMTSRREISFQSPSRKTDVVLITAFRKRLIAVVTVRLSEVNRIADGHDGNDDDGSRCGG